MVKTPQHQIDELGKEYLKFSGVAQTRINGHRIREECFYESNNLLGKKILLSVDGFLAMNHAFIRDDGLWFSYHKQDISLFQILDIGDLYGANFVNLIPPVMDGYISSLELHNKIGEAAPIFRRWRRKKGGVVTHGDFAFYPLSQYLEWMET